ncbi:hypothetical protein DFH11DRAFT_1519526, partial [Phellopilus nigrolimitatus]
NVFSLVERFTFRPSPTESSLPTPPPFLQPEMQYVAGVIVRNACRKDGSRGGIRQCVNMLCGKWESFPREFSKCRRCWKAKYCGKECQSRAWCEGRRFWCSAREGDDITEGGLGVGKGQNAEGDGDGAQDAVASLGVWKRKRVWRAHGVYSSGGCSVGSASRRFALSGDFGMIWRRSSTSSARQSCA